LVKTYRFRNPFLSLFAVLAGLLALTPPPAPAAESTAPITCPTQINPSKSFFYNFNNSCYAIPLLAGAGSSDSGDPNATYDQIYYQVSPGYQLIVYGVYPNARFLSATVYDSHLVNTSSMFDADIVPLLSTMVNPLLPGATFKPSQYYGLTISFGGGNPVNVSPGCSTSASNVGANVLDASQIHQGLSWNGWLGPPPLPAGFPEHQSGANTAGILMIRKYLDIDNPKIIENVIVRSLTDGCAITALQAEQLNILSVSQGLSSPWLNQSQISSHQVFAKDIQPSWCFPQDPENQMMWQRSTNYIPLNDNYAGYLNAAFSTAQIQDLLLGQDYLRIQFQLPTTPDTPCATGTCTLTGNEQIRYMSLSFQGPAVNVAGPVTLFSLSDQQFVRDPNGNVTILAGIGLPQPSFATAANYYTWVDLTNIVNIDSIIGLRVRHLLNNPSFTCSTFNVPYQTTEFNPAGGYMGNFVPTVDFPTLAELPQTPTPPNRPNTCTLVPSQLPQVCGYTNYVKSAPACRR
jgi:hypothetical protein